MWSWNSNLKFLRKKCCNFGYIIMNDNPYKDYYEASIRDDEWAGVDKAEALKRIEEMEYTESWTGEHIDNNEYQFSGGA